MWRIVIGFLFLTIPANAQTLSLPTLPCMLGTTAGTCRDAALGIAAETAAQNSANTNATNISGIMAKLPSNASAITGTMYASTCNVTVNTATATSTFCPVATDSTSATKRTYPAGTLTVGKAFMLQGGGKYTVTLNMNTATIAIMAGSSMILSIVTPAAPIGVNQGVTFNAICSVRTSTTMACNGRFSFNVAGTGLTADAPFDGVGTFNPAVDNVIDVMGNWNGTVTTQTTTVTQAVLTALN